MVGFWANTDVQNCRWQFQNRVTSTRFMRWASGRFTGILRQTFQDLGHWPLILHSVGGSCKSPILKSATTDWAGGRIYNVNFVHHWWLVMMMVMVMMLVIRIILGSYLQFGGCTVSIAQMCRGTSWFIHSHFSVSIAPHSSAHIVPDIVISQPTLLPSLLVGCFCTWWVGGVVQGTDYWDFTPGCCPTRPTVCHTFWSRKRMAMVSYGFL